MSSRARKILGLLMENKVPDCENPSPDFGLEYEKLNNSNKDSNHEVQHEQNFPVETEDKTIAESIEHFDKTNKVAITKAQFEQAKSNNCHLVPYSDSDISLSDHDDNNTTRYTTTEAEYKNEENTVRQSSSSSNSSNLQTARHYVTVDETDDDKVIENTPPQQQYLENRRNELNRHPRDLFTKNPTPPWDSWSPSRKYIR